MKDVHVDPQKLLAALVLSWGPDTAYQAGDWLPSVPDLMQCVPTAMVVQDYFLGAIWRAPLPGGGSHYWNVHTVHGTVDFTGNQFVYLHLFPLYRQAKERRRSVLLRSPEVRRRYEILAARVEQNLDRINVYNGISLIPV